MNRLYAVFCVVSAIFLGTGSAQSSGLPRSSDFFPRYATPGEWIRDTKALDNDRIGSSDLSVFRFDSYGNKWYKIPSNAREGSQVVFKKGADLSDPDILREFALNSPRRIQIISENVHSIIISGNVNDLNTLFNSKISAPISYLDARSNKFKSVDRIVFKAREILKDGRSNSAESGNYNICGEYSKIVEIFPEMPIGIALELIESLKNELKIEIYADPTTDLHPPSSAAATFGLGSGPNADRSLVNGEVFNSAGLLGIKMPSIKNKMYIFDTFDGSEDYANYTIEGYRGSLKYKIKEHGSIVGKIVHDIVGANYIPKSICEVDKCNIKYLLKAFCEISNELRGGDIINLSAGTSYESQMLLKIIQNLTEKNIYLVTSFGNHDRCKNYRLGDTCSHYPSDYIASNGRLNILIAAAWDPYARKISLFNRHYNKEYYIPISYREAFLLPGEYYYQSASNSNKYVPFYGTSFSAPVLTSLLSIWLNCFDNPISDLQKYKSNGQINYKEKLNNSKCK